MSDLNDRTKLLKAEDLARMLNVNTKTVYRLRIPQVRIRVRTIRWKLEDVEKFIADRYDEAA